MTRSRRFFASSPWIATGTPDYVNLGYTSRGLAKQALMRLSGKSLAIFRKLGLGQTSCTNGTIGLRDGAGWEPCDGKPSIVEEARNRALMPHADSGWPTLKRTGRIWMLRPTWVATSRIAGENSGHGNGLCANNLF